MIPAKFWIGGALSLMPGVLLAVGSGNNASEPSVRVVMAKDAGVEVQLEARQAPLAQVLSDLASKTGVRIHYSVVPEGLVTATCVGTTVKPVIECLLNHKANLAVRYTGQSSKANPQGQPAEVWILGTTFGVGQATAGLKGPDGSATAEAQPLTMRKVAKAKSDPLPDATGELVTMAKSPNPSERADAVGRLLAGGRKGDTTVIEALEAALSDEDPKVRAQAITSLAIREGAGAAAALQQAMHDSDVSVRLTAVARAGDNTAILQQALTDSDAAVREMAAMRLDPQSKTGNFR